jgi:DNA-binding XRE family transcriptional regulator
MRTERNKVKQAIRDAGLTQKALADELGIVHWHLCHVLQGRRPFSRQLAKGLAAALRLRGQHVDADAMMAEAPDRAEDPEPVNV